LRQKEWLKCTTELKSKTVMTEPRPLLQLMLRQKPGASTGQ
jgi:hypothetical protein